MTTSVQGGCLCGAIRYEVQGNAVFEAQCFCRDCQRHTGTGHASVAAYPTGAVKVTGEPKSYSCEADNGATATRRFCATCGSTLFSNSSGNPALTLVHVGTFDDPSGFTPKVGVYEKRRSKWDHRDPQLACFPEMPGPRRAG